MANVKRFLEPAVVLAFAVIFLLYHIFATVLGLVSFGQVLLSEEATPQVESTAAENSDRTVTKVSQSNQIVLGADVAQERWPKRIVITPISLNTAMYGLKDGASKRISSDTLVAYDPNSAIPNGKAGNTIVFGKDSGGPFQELHNLKVGGEILIQTSSVSYTYAVVGFKFVSDTELSVISQTNHPSLTLLAINPEDSTRHFAVVANFSRINLGR